MYTKTVKIEGIEKSRENLKDFVNLNRLQPAFLCAILPIVPRSAQMEQKL